VKRDFSITLIIVVLAVIFSFTLPIHADSNSSWLTQHLQSAFSIGQGILFISAGFFTFQGIFRIKTLAGIIGKALKVFSIGLALLGLGFIQVPFMNAYNLWTSFYFTSNIYYLIYALGAILMLLGLLIAGIQFAKKVAISVILVVILSILFRISLSYIPQNMIALLGRSLANYKVTLTLDTIFVGVTLLITIISILITNSFGSSKVGRIFRLITLGFIFILIGVFMTVHLNIIDFTKQWYYLNGIYYSTFFIGSFFLTLFGLRLKYFRI